MYGRMAIRLLYYSLIPQFSLPSQMSSEYLKYPNLLFYGIIIILNKF